MSDIRCAIEVAESAGLKKVKSWTYPNTYAVIPATSLMAEQVRNRDSASWKKAEHIILMGLFPDAGAGLLPYWREFAAADPEGKRSVQKFYVRIDKERYAVYDACGQRIGMGPLSEVLR